MKRYLFSIVLGAILAFAFNSWKDVPVQPSDSTIPEAEHETDSSAEQLAIKALETHLSQRAGEPKPSRTKRAAPVPLPLDTPEIVSEPPLYCGGAAVESDSIFEFTEVETLPVFPGGDPALLHFLLDNIDIRLIKEDCTPRTGALKFVVHSNGAISGITTLRDAGCDTTEWYKNALQKMPPWKPAFKNGQPVAVYMTMPIRIRVE